jgi:toxin ParE1/3/4
MIGPSRANDPPDQLSPEAKEQLGALYRYLAAEAAPEIARAYTAAIAEKCETLADFPNRGTPRDDLRPGLRTIPFRRRATIVYAVMRDTVVIIGIVYAGRDLEAMLREE